MGTNGIRGTPGETPILPTWDQLERARNLFEDYEPRDLFYRAATEFVALALDGKTSLSITESVAVLLQTWNAQYYRFHPFNATHFNALEAVIDSHQEQWRSCRLRAIISMTTNEFDAIAEIFTAFELVLGPVGAAKTLHLLAPEFFPLWDRKIAEGYGISLGTAGENAVEYVRFMTVVVSQISHVTPHEESRGILKRIDEFNYCRFTKGWT
jgi:hypothetical protein